MWQWSTAGFSTMHLHVSCGQASIILPILFSCPFAAHTLEHHGADNKKQNYEKLTQHPPQSNQTMTMAYNDKSTKNTTNHFVEATAQRALF